MGNIARGVVMMDSLSDNQRREVKTLTPNQQTIYFSSRNRGKRSGHVVALSKAKAVKPEPAAEGFFVSPPLAGETWPGFLA